MDFRIAGVLHRQREEVAIIIGVFRCIFVVGKAEGGRLWLGCVSIITGDEVIGFFKRYPAVGLGIVAFAGDLHEVATESKDANAFAFDKMARRSALQIICTIYFELSYGDFPAILCFI